jgi:hypothetical protein
LCLSAKWEILAVGQRIPSLQGFTAKEVLSSRTL